MDRTATETEAPAGSKGRAIGVLFYVLRYDHLLGDDARPLPALVRDTLEITLGRAPKDGDAGREPGRVALHDRFVSSRHARVWRRGTYDVIEDVGSKYGTFVNGERVAARELHDGDLVEIGRSLLVYRLLDEPLASFAAAPRDAFRLGPTLTLSPVTRRLVADLDRLAPTSQPVLLLGETGTGKEVAASHVHARSGRRGRFVAINCAAVPEHLLEAELFGHVKGAFSGAAASRDGKIRAAEGGTVFLDEIGEMPLSAQAKLLRVIEDREVVPVGADRGKLVDVRWIAATNVDIFAASARFRPDLRARLAGYRALVPPLRERREDLGVLTAHLLSEAERAQASIRPKAGFQLFSSAFPENVRGLRNLLLRASILAGDGPIDEPHLDLPDELGDERGGHGAPLGAAPPSRIGIEAAGSAPRRRRPERAVIEAALAAANGRQGAAARALGIDERQLARWMDHYGIPRAGSLR